MRMTDQPYDEREDERSSQEGARGVTEAGEEGKPHSADELEPEATEDESAPDF